MLIFFFPETSSATILLKRAKRLRKRTGNENLRSESEIQSSQMTAKDVAMMTLVLPVWLSLSEPICFFLNRERSPTSFLFVTLPMHQTDWGLRFSIYRSGLCCKLP